MFSKLSFGWTAILMLCVLGFAGCDDDEVVAPPVIGTITDIASGDDRFTTLVAALERTGLDANLDVPSSRLTVFAPTNDAFAAAGIDVNAVDEEDLRNILLYHVISGGTIYRTANIPAGETNLATLNTQGPSDALEVTVNSSGGNVTVNGANVIAADIEGVNGVIHAIDDVLMTSSIVDRAVADGRFTTLVAALQRTGLDATLAGDGDFTVFAPTDDAFTAAGIDLDALSDDELSDVLLYHVVGTGIPAGSIGDGDNFVTSLSTSGPDDAPLTLLVNQTNGDVTVNGSSSVVVADVFGNNGVVHAVNQVLSPQSIVDFATKADALSTLATALTNADLVTTLQGDGPFTVFAPVNGAFEAAADTIATLTMEQVTNVLTYHVVAGANVRSTDIPASAATVNGQALTFFDADDSDDDDSNNTIRSGAMQEVGFEIVDIQGTNGVVHVIGTVLLPETL